MLKPQFRSYVELMERFSSSLRIDEDGLVSFEQKEDDFVGALYALSCSDRFASLCEAHFGADLTTFRDELLRIARNIGMERYFSMVSEPFISELYDVLTSLSEADLI